MKRLKSAPSFAPARSGLSHWKGRTVLVTAGPTREALDPVRFLSNSSSGRMGYALAETAQNVGANVVLISGPTALKPPSGVRFVPVVSARDMLRAALRHGKRADLIIGAAAVADWRPTHFQSRKIKKFGASKMKITLTRNPDIIKTLSKRFNQNPCFVIGFALETNGLLANAGKKLKEKSLDMIVANPARVIDRRTTQAYILRPGKPTLRFPSLSKASLARHILSLAAESLP